MRTCVCSVRAAAKLLTMLTTRESRTLCIAPIAETVSVGGALTAPPAKPPSAISRARHGGQGESLVPPYTRGSVSLALSHGGQGESLEPPYTRGSFSLSGPRAKAWCLLIHAEASLPLESAWFQHLKLNMINSF